MTLTNAMDRVKKYGTLVMFQHTIFSLSFGLVAMLLASGGHISLRLILLILIALLSARTGANAINRVIDSEIDAKNPRTATRQLPQGIVKRKEALLFSIICFIIMIIATFMINPLCAALLPLAILMMIAYSFTKRFTFLCHLFLGITCAIAPLGAWLAVTGNFGGLTPVFSIGFEAIKSIFTGHFHEVAAYTAATWSAFRISITQDNAIYIPIFLAATNAVWVAGFDIIYGSQDVAFDRANGIHSTPAKFGIKKALFISSLLHVLAFIFLLIVGILSPKLNIIYFVGVFIIGILLIIEHIIVKPDNLTHAKVASYSVNEVVSIVFMTFAIIDIFI